MRQRLNFQIKRVMSKIGRSMLGPLERKRLDEVSAVDKTTQLLLTLRYKELLRQNANLSTFDEVEFRAFSQNGEDGILLYIFSLMGSTNKRAVEICAGDGIQCNCANLIINHGWNALLVDGDEANVRAGRAYYSECPDTKWWPPTFVNAWVLRDNVNSVIRAQAYEGEIDLLSLDMDGMDYWIWEALDCINPRVVVLEYQCIWGPDKSVTVPYDPSFVAEIVDGGANYSGASLAAFVKLGRRKGYRLIGCQRYGFNAFFMRSDIGQDIFPEIPTSECFGHPAVQDCIARRLPTVINREWLEV